MILEGQGQGKERKGMAGLSCKYASMMDGWMIARNDKVAEKREREREREGGGGNNRVE